MGSWVSNGARSVQGRSRIFQYVNDEAESSMRTTVCGQAAALTALAAVRPKTEDRTTHAMRALCGDDRYKPDNFFGLAGTSSNRLLTILREHFKLHATMLDNLALVRKHVSAGKPVVVMTDVGYAGWDCLFGIGGHWTVLYGLTKYNYLLSNWYQPGFGNDAEGAGGSNVCSRAVLEGSMNTWLVKASGMGNKGILVSS